MKINLMPETRLGKLAVWFGVALVVLTMLSLILAVVIGGDPAVIESNHLLSILAAILSILFTLAGPTSFILGVITIIKHKEWSIYKPLGIIYILTLLLFLFGEFLFPH